MDYPFTEISINGGGSNSTLKFTWNADTMNGSLMAGVSEEQFLREVVAFFKSAGVAGSTITSRKVDLSYTDNTPAD